MFGGFGMTELIVILVIVVMLFGTKKLEIWAATWDLL